MTAVKFLNGSPGYVRTLRRGDCGLKRNATWSEENGFVVDLPEAESESLVGTLPMEFAMAKAPNENADASDDMQAASPDGSANDSVIDEKKEVFESPDAGNPRP